MDINLSMDNKKKVSNFMDGQNDTSCDYHHVIGQVISALNRQKRKAYLCDRKRNACTKKPPPIKSVSRPPLSNITNAFHCLTLFLTFCVF